MCRQPLRPSPKPWKPKTVSIETLQSIADPLRTGLMVVALAAFLAIVAWTFLRPRERMEADAHLWNDDEK